MDKLTIFTITVSILLIMLASYHIWTMIEDRKDNEQTEDFISSVSQSGVPGIPSRIYGEDHPVVSYYNKINTYGTDSPIINEEVTSQQLLLNNVLSNQDHKAHSMYYKSNAHRYPIQQAGDPSDHRSTMNSYIAGTRSMRAVRIDPTEAQIPNKLETPVDPLIPC